MIEQKVINKNGKVFTKIKTSKNIKSSFEQFSLSMLLRNYKYIQMALMSIQILFSGRKYVAIV